MDISLLQTIDKVMGSMRAFRPRSVIDREFASFNRFPLR